MTTNTGPVIVVTGDGQVRMWNTARATFPPGGEPNRAPDAQRTVSPAAVAALFQILMNTDFSALPHGGGAGAECGANLWFRVDPSSEATMLGYDSSAQVTPELECIWEWFDGVLGSSYADYNPRGYCAYP